MIKGELSFSLDGVYMGVAFKDQALKKGPLYASVALLHKAGCYLSTVMPLPSYFIV